MAGSPHQVSALRMPFAPNTMSTPRSSFPRSQFPIMGTNNYPLNSSYLWDTNVQLHTSNQTFLNITRNGSSGYGTQVLPNLANTQDQSSFLGLLNGQVQGTDNAIDMRLNGLPQNSPVSSQVHTGLGQLGNANTSYENACASQARVQGSGVLCNSNVTNRENSFNGLARPALNVIPSKPRVVRTTARDISLYQPLTQPSVPCMCNKQKVSIGTQYENDPFLAKVYTKKECMTQGTDAFNEVSVSCFYYRLQSDGDHALVSVCLSVNALMAEPFDLRPKLDCNSNRRALQMDGQMVHYLTALLSYPGR